MTTAPRSSNGAQPFITVVIPTRDRPEDLDTCVRSVLACDYPRFEVLVMDQSEVPTPLMADPRLRVVPLRSVGKSRAINAAMQLAQGDILACTDDDCTVTSNWLSRAAEDLACEPDAGLVFGSLIPAPHNPAVTYIPRYEPEHYLRLRGASAYVHNGGPAGANLIVRRSVLQELGGFDPELGPGTALLSCEDPDLYYRVLRAGGTVIVDPGLAVFHHGGRSLLTGDGQRLLRGYAFGLGAVDAKHLRCGDMWALFSLLKRTREYGWYAIRNVILRRRLTGLGLLAYTYLGFVRGLRYPLDREQRLFRGLKSLKSARMASRT